MKLFRIISLLLCLSFPAISHAGWFGSGTVAVLHNSLIEAADKGNGEYVQYLITMGYPVDAVDDMGQSALMKAANRGNQAIVKTLINANANVNLQDKLGNTALHYAAQHDNYAALEELIRGGALVTVKNVNGQTPLQVAVASNSVNVTNILAYKAGNEIKGIEPVSAMSEPVISTKVMLLGAVSIVGGGVAVAAIGKGGGGGSAGSGSSSGSSVPGASSFETPEYYTADRGAGETNTTNGLGLIKASSAYARGASGSGVVVAVVDTGVDLTHPELQSNILNSGYDFVNDDSTAQDDQGHGTHVAGIIAGVRGNTVDDSQKNMMGVAYSAKILPVKVMNSSGTGTYADIASGITYARTHGADVINMSLGGSADSGVSSAISSAMSHGLLVFAATGNESDTDPHWPAQYAATLNDSIATGAIIAVGAVDSSKTVADFSNHCGVAKTWCLVAPGVDIHSTVWDGGSSYAVHDGTSMATPFASGAAAVLLGEFPTLTSREVAELLLETADDLGDPGVDDVYGHGLINLEKASNPVGQVIVPLSTDVSGPVVPLDDSHITMPHIFGDAVKNSNLSFAILDKYNRAFTVPLANVVSTSGSKTEATDSFEDFADPIISKVPMANIGGNVAMGLVTSENKALPDQPGVQQGTTSYFSSVIEGDGMKEALNYNIPVAQYLGFAAAKGLDGSTFIGDATHGNPYLGLVSDGISSVSSFSFENGIRTNFAMFDGKNQDSGYATSGVASEIAFESSGFALSSQFGVISEKDSMLGAHSTGAFAMGGSSTPTMFYSIAGSVNITDNARLFGVFSEGITRPEDAAGSLINSVSEIRSQSFAGGVMVDNNFMDDDLIGFAVSSPLHVVSGSAAVSLPYARDMEGNILRTNQQLNLAAAGVETDVELFYKVPVESSTITIGAMRRMQPGNIKSADNDDLVLLKFLNKF